MSCEIIGDLHPPTERINRIVINKSESPNAVRLNQQSTDNHSNNGFLNDEDELKYGAKHVIKIFIPVSICMLIVVITILSLPYYQRTNMYMVYTPFTDQKVEPTVKLWQSVANALILICVIAVMSVLLIVLYKKRYYKVINGWLIISSLSLLFMITSVHVFELLKVLNVPLDTLTVVLVIWNFGVIGMIAIHWKGPMIVQQSYLLFISSLMALSFIKFIPEWTIWTVLATVSIWDLIAVLCPKGPLRILVETAQERNEQLFPSLVYSSGVAYNLVLTIANDVKEELSRDENQLINFQSVQANEEQQHQESSINQGSQSEQVNRQNSQNSQNSRHSQGSKNTSNQTVPNSSQQQQSSRLLLNGVQLVPDTSYSSNQGDDSSIPIVNNSSSNSSSSDDSGVKLGLGDFVFYSILVGKVSTYGDWNTTIACFVAILIGLCLTLLLLSIIKTALPALPISITFGLIFYFSTSFVVQPFTSELAYNQIFI